MTEILSQRAVKPKTTTQPSNEGSQLFIVGDGSNEKSQHVFLLKTVLMRGHMFLLETVLMMGHTCFSWRRF